MWKIITGDALQVLNELNDEVHLTVTSPPYYLSRGQFVSPYGDDASDIELRSYEGYIEYLTLLFRRVHDITVPGGKLAIVIDDVHVSPKLSGEAYEIVYPTHALLTVRLVEMGWLYKGLIIWKKMRSANASGGAATLLGSFPYPPNIPITQMFEFILMFQKKGKRRKPTNVEHLSKELQRNEIISFEEFKEWASTGVWNIQPEHRADILNPCPFPVAIPYLLIKFFSHVGETVLDPFCGSGTTGVAAVRLHRNFIGVELYERYAEEARRRIADETSNLFQEGVLESAKVF